MNLKLLERKYMADLALDYTIRLKLSDPLSILVFCFQDLLEESVSCRVGHRL